MLPFKNRLTKRKDHEKVQKLGTFVSLENVAVKWMKNGLSESRVGIVVGLKYSKKAVERNQTKRVLGEAIRSEMKNIEKGLDIVIMARKRAEEKGKNINFRKMMRETLIRGGLIKNKEEASSKTK